MTLRAVIADRDEDQRHLLALALGRDPAFGVCASTADGGEAVEQVVAHAADLLLFDVDLAGVDGVEVAARVHEARPSCAAVLVSSIPPAELGALPGTVGLIPRSVPPTRLAAEIRAVAAAVEAAGVSARSSSVTLEADRMAPRSARRFVNDVLADAGYGDVLDVVELLVTEVVTNAVLHARTQAEVVARLLPDAVRVEVIDRDDSFPVRRRPSRDQPGGRGFDLVERMSRSWGIDMLEVGKRTWFEVARQEPGT